jgi:hypothetical protein
MFDGSWSIIPCQVQSTPVKHVDIKNILVVFPNDKITFYTITSILQQMIELIFFNPYTPCMFLHTHHVTCGLKHPPY